MSAEVISSNDKPKGNEKGGKKPEGGKVKALEEKLTGNKRPREEGPREPDSAGQAPAKKSKKHKAKKKKQSAGEAANNSLPHGERIGKNKHNLTKEERRAKYWRPKDGRMNRPGSHKKKFCFGCRKMGHRLEQCNEKAMVKICFSCGSSEHGLKDCPEPKSDGSCRFATCFVCGEQGHLSSQCPSNEKGVFPEGGACHKCKAKDHKSFDCPLNKHNRPVEVAERGEREKGRDGSHKPGGFTGRMKLKRDLPEEGREEGEGPGLPTGGDELAGEFLAEDVGSDVEAGGFKRRKFKPKRKVDEQIEDVAHKPKPKVAGKGKARVVKF